MQCALAHLEAPAVGTPGTTGMEDGVRKTSEGEDWEETGELGQADNPFCLSTADSGREGSAAFGPYALIALGPQSSLEPPRVGMTAEFPLQVDVW